MRQRSLLRKNHHVKEEGRTDIDDLMCVESRLSGKESLFMVIEMLKRLDFDELEGVYGSLQTLQRGRSS